MQNYKETESIVTRVLDSRWTPCHRKNGWLSFFQKGGRLQFVSGIDTSAGRLPVVINVYPQGEILDVTGRLPEKYFGKEWERARRIVGSCRIDSPSRNSSYKADFILSRNKGEVGYRVSGDFAECGLNEVVRHCLDQVIQHLGHFRLMIGSEVDEQ